MTEWTLAETRRPPTCTVERVRGLGHFPGGLAIEKTGFILVKSKETKGTYVYEEDLGEGGKPPALKTQSIQKWMLGKEPPEKIKVTVEPA